VCLTATQIASNLSGGSTSVSHREGRSRMNSTEGATIIGANTKVQGELSGTESLLVQGEVEGTINLPGGMVTIGEQGRVRANIFAQDILVSGRVHGDLLATGSVQLRSSAMVLGDITSPRFTIEEDAMLRGHVEPAVATGVAVAETATHHEGGTLPAALAAAERQIHESTTGASSDHDGDLFTTGGSDAPSHS